MEKDIEVEVKYTLNKTTQKKVSEYIKTNGYKLKAGSNESDTYYSRPDVDFLDTKECLRIRRAATYSELTYKPGSTNDMRKQGRIWKQELNLNLPDKVAEETIHDILMNLDFIELVTVEKQRKTYSNSGVNLSLDKITGLGNFLEIEIMSSETKIKDSLLMIDQIVDELGLEPENKVTLPYRDLLLGLKK